MTAVVKVKVFALIEIVTHRFLCGSIWTKIRPNGPEQREKKTKALQDVGRLERAVLAAAGGSAAADAVGGRAARGLRGRLLVQLLPLLLPVPALLSAQAAKQRDGLRAERGADGERHGGAPTGGLELRGASSGGQAHSSRS
ncbi:unnamed protein product [Phytophthora lilii]|uniref:Unnamed protein product n=1 Tax=Phytophthora lilii TaxID=2077276 RepID=A0A9W6TAH7_9STRA|nr:unnamed protein product [Phytophthora lilii]